MIGIYLGIFIFVVGSIITLVVNGNVEVPISNDFFDMPIRIKIGIALILLGILMVCASVIFTLVTNPAKLL